MRAAEELLGLRAVGGLYQPLAGSDLRARGVLDGDSGVELDCVSTDVREHDELRELLDEALAAGARGGRAGGRGAIAGAAAARARSEAAASIRRSAGASGERAPRADRAARDASGHGVGRGARHGQRRGADADRRAARGGRGAARSRCSCRRPPAAARRRCSSSASCGPCATTASRPARILAITFTERAAGELRERVRERLLGARRPPGGARHRGGVRRHLPRLLRAAAARTPARGRPRPRFRDPRRGPGAGALREQAFADGRARAARPATRAAAVDLLAAYGVDRVRSMIEQVYAGAAQPRPAPAAPARR